MSIHQSHATLFPAAMPVPVSTAGNTSTTNNTSGIPQLHSRAVGSHARSFGFDWDKRTEQHRYRRELGLPDIHAAIINDDWDTALELVCPEDLGLLWIPPTSHHSSPTWANTLFSKDKTKQQFAIIDMATEKVGTTTVGADVVAYGANLLTLSLLIPCPKVFRDKVFQMAAEQNSSYLHLPDGSGRTPLWIAVDKGDVDAVKFLLNAGVSSLSPCPFASEGNQGVPLAWAANKCNNEIFALCLEKPLDEYFARPFYYLKEDSLQLQRWAKNKDEADIAWLADRFPQLRQVLFTSPNATGATIYHRYLLGDEQCKNFVRSAGAKRFSGREFCPNYFVGTDPGLGPSITILSLHARKTSPSAFINCLKTADIFMRNLRRDSSFYTPAEVMYFRSISDFIRNRSIGGVVELIPYLNSKEFVSLLLSEFIGRLQRSDLADYRTFVNALWPFLTDRDKLKIFAHSATRNDGRSEFVLGKMDCSLDEDTLKSMIKIAAKYGNRTAFEYACERSSEIGNLLEVLHGWNPNWYAEEARILAKNALAVGSTSWFFRLVQAGLNVDSIIADQGEICLPILSDRDPEGLPTRLAYFEDYFGESHHSFEESAPDLDGLPARLAAHGFFITDQMIARATTEAGKQALRKLQYKDSSTQ